MRTVTRRVAISIALLALVYFASRAPYYAHPVIGEEGLFANLLLDPPPFPHFILAGRVAGEDIHLNFNHPIAPYLWLRAAGSNLRAALAQDTSAADLVGPIRLHFSLYLFLVLAGAMAYAARRDDEDTPTRAALVLVASATPLAVASSIQLYLDGSVGVFATGLAGLALVAATDDAWPARVRGAAAAAGGVFVGLARPEWCVVYLVAAFAAWVWGLARKSENAARFPLAAALVGAAIGVGAGYAANPENFMNHLTNSASILGGERTRPYDMANASLRQIVVFRLWAVVPVAAMLALCSFAFLRRPRAHALAPLLFAGGLFAGYASGLFNDLFDYRYYAPALAASATAWVACSREGLGRAGRAAAALAVAAMLIVTAQFHQHAIGGRLSITMGPGMPVAAYFADRAERVRRAAVEDCVPVLPVWSKYEFDKIDFIIPSVARPDAERIAAEHGRRLCP